MPRERPARCLASQYRSSPRRAALSLSSVTLGDDCADSRRTLLVVTCHAVLVDLFDIGRLCSRQDRVPRRLPPTRVARPASFFVTNLGWEVEQVCTAEGQHHWAVPSTRTEPDARSFDHIADSEPWPPRSSDSERTIFQANLRGHPRHKIANQIAALRAARDRS